MATVTTVDRTYRIKGVSPIILHNSRLADPLDEWSKLIKEISAKKKKTEADQVEMSRREWFGGLYLNEDRVIIPSQNLERMIRDAATKSKLGKVVQSGVIVQNDAFLDFKDKAKSPEELWELKSYSIRESCKVGQSRVIRTRPCFYAWGLTFTATIDTDLLNQSQVDEFVLLAGRIIGLCDHRPKYGRFDLEEMK